MKFHRIFTHKVREYAVKCLKTLEDGDLADFLIQLTQVIKYEPYHDSALARFLLQRAFNNKDIIGQHLVWNLRVNNSFMYVGDLI